MTVKRISKKKKRTSFKKKQEELERKRGVRGARVMVNLRPATENQVQD